MQRCVIQMHPEYLEQVLAIEGDSFDDPWPLSAFVAELGHPWSWFKGIGLADKAGTLKELEGFIICWMLTGDLHILNLAVQPLLRRRGLGRTLVNHVLKEFAKKGGGWASLEVRPSNLPAQKLYLSLEFEIAGVRPRYYRKNNEDALIMVRKIPAGERGQDR